MAKTREELVAQKALVDEKVAILATIDGAGEYISARIAALTAAISKYPITAPRSDGNITMRQNLEQCLTECADTPNIAIAKEIDSWLAQSSRLSNEIAALDEVWQ